MLTSPPQLIGGTLELGKPVTSSFAGTDAEPVFSPEEVEEILMRRFNPLSSLKASTLTAALDAFDIGDFQPAARLWVKMAERDRWLKTVKDKREEAIELRPHLIETMEESPEAKDQQKVLEVFFGNLRASHAMDRHITGGFSLLRRQMMESASFKYANHHLRWDPDGAQTFDLPSGRAVPVLRLTCEYVPLEYFEGRTGALRFLGSDVGYFGKDLAPGHWMTTTGPALMVAASIAIYEGRIARHDRLNLSEKWGQPAVIGHTTGGKASVEGKAMSVAVKSVAANYRGVLYGSDRNEVEFVQPAGGGGASSTPMKEIMEDVKREVTTLYLGGDLSTISRDNGVGASLQGDAENDRQRADCLRVGETLNATLVPTVIAWYFGDGARVLAKVVIEAPDNEDRKTLGEAVQMVVDLGGEVPIAPVAKRLNVPIAKTGEAIFQKPVTPTPPPAFNALVKPGADAPMVGRLLAAARSRFGTALSADLQPLRTALEKVLQGDDGQLHERALALHGELPALGAQIIAADHSSDALYEILSAALAEGLSQTHAS